MVRTTETEVARMVVASMPSLSLDGSAVVGQTYPAREALRAAGGRWDPARRAWVYLSPEAAQAAMERASGSGGTSASPGTCACGRAIRGDYPSCYRCSAAGQGARQTTGAGRYARTSYGCRCSGRPGGGCCDRDDCVCYDCQ